MKVHIPFLYTVFYLFIILVNTLANILPLNGKTTGELSDKYDSLVTPAGFAFSIWSLIYLLLAVFIWKVWKEHKTHNNYTGPLLKWFILQAIFNMTWLISWHYELIGLSVFIMLGLLVSIISIYRYVTFHNRWRLPWSVYLGWISVATIVNISVFFLANDIQLFTDNGEIFAFLMVFIALILGGFMLVKQNDLYFPLVIAWALFFIGMANRGFVSYTYCVWFGSVFLVFASIYKYLNQIKSK